MLSTSHDSGSSADEAVRGLFAEGAFLRGRSWVCLGVTVLLAMALFMVNSHAASAAGSGSVKGTVANASGVAVGNVVIAAQSGTTVVATGTSDANGSFTLDIADGTYDLVLTPAPGSGYQRTQFNAVAVTSAAPVHLVLVSGNPVSVTGRAGYLVDGVFQPPSSYGMVTFMPLTANTPTTTVGIDPYGHFTATVIAGATYKVGGTMFGSPMGADTYDVEAASSMAFAGGEVLDLAVPTSRVTVQVRNLGGQPVSGASISTSSTTMNTGALVVESDDSGLSGTTTDTGTVVAHIPTGAHLTDSTLNLTGGLSIRQTLPDITGDITITLTAPATASVTGRMGLVVDGVFQPPTSTGGITDVWFQPQAANTSFTTVSPDSLGHFTATVIAGATYQVSGSFDSPYNNRPPFWVGSVSFVAASNMVFAGGEVLDLAIPTSRVTVHVRDLQGNPVSGVSISTAASTKGTAAPVQSDIRGATAATGTFGTAGELSFDIPTGAHLTGSTLNLNGLATPESLPDITADTMITLTAPGAASVTGRLGFVMDGALQTTGGSVTFTPQTPNTLTTTAQANSAGQFTATVLAGATYQVSGSADSAAPGLSARFDAAASRTLAGGEVLDLAIPTSRVTVLVRDQNGGPVSGASISTAYSTMGTGQRAVESQGSDSSAATSTAGTVVTYIPTGAHLTNAILNLSGGLPVPVTLPDVTGDQTVVISYDYLTGVVSVPAPISIVALTLSNGADVTDAVTLSATVTSGLGASMTPTGTVQFSYTLNGGPMQTVGAPVVLDPNGLVVLTLPHGLPHPGPGPYSFSFTGAFTPTASSLFTAGVSAPLQVSLQGAAQDCTTCTDPQTMVVTVPVGALMISTPYTANHPFSLGRLTLDANGTRLSGSAPFGTSAPAGTDPGTLDASSAASTTNGVTITDTRPGNVGWSASAQTTDFTGPSGTTTPIPGDNLSFSGVTPKYLIGNQLQDGSVSTHDISGFHTSAKSFATTPAGPGTVNIYGTFALTAATSTMPGLYSATLTLTIS
jgi:hypothetical protein